MFVPAPDDSRIDPPVIFPTLRPTPRRCCIPAEAVFAILASACFAIAYGANVVLSITIVAMVNQSAISGDDHHVNGSVWTFDKLVMQEFRNAVQPECPPPPGHQEDKDGPFVWDEIIQGNLRGSYYYGYLIAQLPGAILAEKYSAKWVLWVANVLNIIGLLITPVVAVYSHYGVLIFVRIVMGLGGAMTFPAMHVMISHWAQPSQRGVIGGVVYAGTSVGTIGATLVGGYVAAALGWEWVFYILGLLSLPWCVFWICLVTEYPEENPDVQQHGDMRQPQADFPLKAVCKSLPFWAILITHFCSNCGWYMFLTELPGFMKEVLHKNIKENAGISTIPYVLMWVLSVCLGWFLDNLRKKEIISTGTMRKIATAIASLIPCFCMIGISFIGCNAYAGIIIITVAVTACAGMFVGFLSNHIDLSPKFAGRLMAITNTVATIPGILMPVIIGELTEGEETLARWNIAFYGTAVLYAFMFIVYTCFASGDEQPWNNPGNPKRDDRKDDERLMENGNASDLMDSMDPYEPSSTNGLIHFPA